MTLSHWFDQSPNGKHFVLPGLEFLHNIYEKINTRTNKISPELNLLESEAAKMRIFFHTKIRDICSALEFSLMVEYDAHVFLHKYFIKHGLLDHDTKHIMLACIYLASKTQNMHLTMDQFVSKIPNSQTELIVQLEVVILEASDFRPPIFSPVTCLYGFILDVLPILNSISDSDFDYQEFSQKALERLQISFLIDEIILIESPSHIALACVLSSNETCETYWDERLNKLDNLNDLYGRIEKINQKIDSFNETSLESLRPIDRKIRNARINLTTE